MIGIFGFITRGIPMQGGIPKGSNVIVCKSDFQQNMTQACFRNPVTGADDITIMCLQAGAPFIVEDVSGGVFLLAHNSPCLNGFMQFRDIVFCSFITVLA